MTGRHPLPVLVSSLVLAVALGVALNSSSWAVKQTAYVGGFAVMIIMLVLAAVVQRGRAPGVLVLGALTVQGATLSALALDFGPLGSAVLAVWAAGLAFVWWRILRRASRERANALMISGLPEVHPVD
ncbi:hypothetical protein [Actinoplanes italicus]|uniref:hypothetical protein n=1 Tax=Actinoplanes italicus TaxID=113567 RepID=UPI0011B26408|nr:hypothetical protein [Actinoplanes italicus]